MSIVRSFFLLLFVLVFFHFSFLCKVCEASVRKTLTLTADSIRPSKTRSKTIFTKSVDIVKDLSVKGNTIGNGSLTVSKAATFKKTLSVAGTAKLNGGLAMDTNRFVVANGTGNTTIAGTLTVADSANLDTVTSAGLATLETLIVTNNTYLNGSYIDVAGETNFNGDVSIAKGKTFYVNELSPIVSDGAALSITGNVNIEGDINILRSNPTVLISGGLASTGVSPISVAFSPNGDFVAVVTNGSSFVRIFSVNGYGNLSSVISQSSDFGGDSVAWSPNWSLNSGGFLATLDGSRLKIFSVDISGQISSEAISSQAIESCPSVVAWAPWGNFIAVANYLTNTVQIFSVDASGNLSAAISSQSTGSYPTAVTWAPTWSASTGGFIAVSNAGSRTLQVFSVDEAGNLSAEISSVLFLGSLWAAAFSPNWSSIDGGFIGVIDSGYRMLRILRIDTTGNLCFVSIASTGNSPYAVAWSPLGNFIAVVNRDSNTLQIFSVDASGKLPDLGPGGRIDSGFYISQQTGSYPTSVVFSSKGNVLALTNQNDNTVQTFKSNFLGNRVVINQNGIVFNDNPLIHGDIAIAGNTLIGGMLDIVGTTTGGSWHHLVGNKCINQSIRLLADGGTKILTIKFVRARGSSPSYNKGAWVHLKCMVTGEVLGSFKEYCCDFTVHVSPKSGTTPKILEQICYDIVANSGGPITIFSTPSSSDTICDIYLHSGTTTISNQAVALFYEVDSDNVASVS